MKVVYLPKIHHINNSKPCIVWCNCCSSITSTYLGIVEEYQEMIKGKGKVVTVL